MQLTKSQYRANKTKKQLAFPCALSRQRQIKIWSYAKFGNNVFCGHETAEDDNNRCRGDKTRCFPEVAEISDMIYPECQLTLILLLWIVEVERKLKKPQKLASPFAFGFVILPKGNINVVLPLGTRETSWFPDRHVCTSCPVRSHEKWTLARGIKQWCRSSSTLSVAVYIHHYWAPIWWIIVRYTRNRVNLKKTVYSGLKLQETFLYNEKPNLFLNRRSDRRDYFWCNFV